MRRVIITGKGSFIGQNIISILSNLKIKEIDLLDKRISDINFSDTDAVIHLAALAHQKKPTPESVYFKVNSDLAFETAVEAKKTSN